MAIDDPESPNKIDTLYAFMSIDADGHNGIIGGVIPGVGRRPLVTGSLALATDIYKPIAEQVALQTGKKVGLFAFDRSCSLWETEP